MNHLTEKRADARVHTLLRRALERASARTDVDKAIVVPLQPALQRRLQERLRGSMTEKWAPGAKEPKRDPLEYMQLCRQYLAKLDTMGWNRSYHQRLFHDDFLKACTRSFWKLEPPGQFARDHQKVLRVNSWDHIAQEILISTPRRFGKTISVSMFCAAMLLACPGVEISIYSTCKRISQKILRNVQKFALMIADADYATLNFGVKRENMEEINLQGPLGNTDVRIINSYPSKVGTGPRQKSAYALYCSTCFSQKSVAHELHLRAKVFHDAIIASSRLDRVSLYGLLSWLRTSTMLLSNSSSAAKSPWTRPKRNWSRK